LTVQGCGTRTGEEFSPDSFATRSYFYMEVPFTSIQVWPILHEDVSGDLARHLQNNKLLGGAPDATKSRWDLVMAFPPPGNRNHLDAAILSGYLTNTDSSGNLVWLDWSNDNPQLAAEFWPRVAELARNYLYIYLPDLFEIAHSATDPKELKRAAEAYLAKTYSEVAETMQATQKPKLAEKFRAASAEHAAAEKEATVNAPAEES